GQSFFYYPQPLEYGRDCDGGAHGAQFSLMAGAVGQWTRVDLHPDLASYDWPANLCPLPAAPTAGRRGADGVHAFRYGSLTPSSGLDGEFRSLAQSDEPNGVAQQYEQIIEEGATACLKP